MRVQSFVPVAAGLLSLSFASSAGAQATRTWVSGVGSDANPCSRTAPCQTFAGAISKTANAGEINALDPGGFGAVTITKSITISSESPEAGVLAAGTNGIIINGAGIFVVLRGLDIEGAGTGLNGIRILNAAAVTVEKCTINGFTQKGIDMESGAATSLFVKDTIIRNNLGASAGGIFTLATSAATQASVTLDNVRLERNTFGIKATNFTRVDVRNSSATASTNNGFWAFSVSNSVQMNIESSTSAQNGVAGIRSEGTATVVRVSNNEITDNAFAFVSGTGGQILTWSNNHVANNGATPGAPTGTITPQ